MKVKVVVRFVEKDVVRHPGEVLELSSSIARRLIESGVVKPVESRKRKEPSEDKARRPSEDKGEAK